MPTKNEENLGVAMENYLHQSPPSSCPQFSSASSSSASSSDEENYIIAETKQEEHPARFESAPNRTLHENFIRKTVEILLKDAVFEGTSRKNPVLHWESPENLTKLLDFHLKSRPETHDHLLELIKTTVKYSVKTGHPYFVNQLFSGLDPYGLVGQWVTDALNPSVYTYEVAPVFTLMEEAVLGEMRRIVGWGGVGGDGIFCPGGSMANGYAISCARFRFLPDIKVSV